MYKTDGVVLRTRNLGEADKIVTVYTKTKGKVVAVARGARRIRNRLLSSTQMFTHGRYLFFDGKTLDTLCQGEIVLSFQPLRDDLDKMAYAMYLCELVDVFVEEGEPSPEIFVLLINSLKMVNEGQVLLALRRFELRLMKCLGYHPEMHHCISCGTEPEAIIYFSKEGGIVCSHCKPQFSTTHIVSRGTWELTKRLLDWEWSRISILHPSAFSLVEIEHCMRDYIDYRLDRPLRSLGFLQTLKQF